MWYNWEMETDKKKVETKKEPRVFHSLQEVYETYLPNRSLEELEDRKKQTVLIIIPRPSVN